MFPARLNIPRKLTQSGHWSSNHWDWVPYVMITRLRLFSRKGQAFGNSSAIWEWSLFWCTLKMTYSLSRQFHMQMASWLYGWILTFERCWYSPGVPSSRQSFKNCLVYPLWKQKALDLRESRPDWDLGNLAAEDYDSKVLHWGPEKECLLKYPEAKELPHLPTWLGYWVWLHKSNDIHSHQTLSILIDYTSADIFCVRQPWVPLWRRRSIICSRTDLRSASVWQKESGPVLY